MAPVAVRLRRPRESDLAPLLARCRDEPLTCSPIGGSLDGDPPDGLRRHEWSTRLPGSSLETATAALKEWAVHRGAGLAVLADGPLDVGTNVAMSAPLPVGFVDLTCRVVAVVDEPHRQGFAYGTLPVHAETGEEAFIVVRDEQGVRFDVHAVSTPRHPLARLVPAVADRLQDRAVKRYLRAMRQRVEG
jgi:uncharacterized protein (UPF0548 family)